MQCSRCGRFIDHSLEIKNCLSVDLYVKVNAKDINGQSIHKWERQRLCPECDKEIYDKFYEKKPFIRY